MDSARFEPLFVDLGHEHAAVDLQHLASDVGRCRVERQESDQPSHLLWLPISPCKHQDHADDRFALVVAEDGGCGTRTCSPARGGRGGKGGSEHVDNFHEPLKALDRCIASVCMHN